ncbi:AP-3 complex subunit beta, putative, partial [Hepatocystis sp. ex Piliocolobus tephrosceles]
NSFLLNKGTKIEGKDEESDNEPIVNNRTTSKNDNINNINNDKDKQEIIISKLDKSKEEQVDDIEQFFFSD